jgi:hypothetical protein
VFALGRHEDVRAALRADDVLVSGRGVALNDLLNDQPPRATLTSDGALHRQRRGVLMRPMMPSALTEVRAELEGLADALVAELLGRDSFDGIADFARHLPVAVVSRLVGLPEEGRERMLAWAAATFDVLGPMNARAQSSAPKLLEMIRYAAGMGRERLRKGGWAARVFAAADCGALDPEDVAGLLIDYIAPSLDTTILGTGSLLYLLGRHPEQYQNVCANPELIPAAVNEALRFDSPVRAFTRYAAARYEAGDVSIPAGERVLILYGAANRDERYEEPTASTTRDARPPAFGHGGTAAPEVTSLSSSWCCCALVARAQDRVASRALMSNMRGYESSGGAVVTRRLRTSRSWAPDRPASRSRSCSRSAGAASSCSNASRRRIRCHAPCTSTTKPRACCKPPASPATSRASPSSRRSTSGATRRARSCCASAARRTPASRAGPSRT